MMMKVPRERARTWLAWNERDPPAKPAQIVLTYRKRADAENVFDELKNQRGFDGFCSGKGVVRETAARLLLLTYNLWSLFVRVLREEGYHREAITSRDDLLVMPAKLVESGRQKTLKLSVGEQWWNSISRAYQRLPTLARLNRAAVATPANFRALPLLAQPRQPRRLAAPILPLNLNCGI